VEENVFELLDEQLRGDQLTPDEECLEGLTLQDLDELTKWMDAKIRGGTE